jgi:predicted transglutaminase-like cysteine proteinase
MSEGSRVRKRFLTFLACGAALGLLTVSGLSCVGRIIYPESAASNWLPATESEFKSYIMPDCQAVKGTLQSILGDPPYTLSQLAFDDIRNWVADNIAYKPDKEQWGKDYWQTPEETLFCGTGDCEDFSILLCSLLRAYGIDAQQVYVALGVNGAQDGHAFVIENWYSDGEWRRVESQAAAQIPSYSRLFFPGSYLDSRLDKYEITAVFNDLYWHDESFSSEATQENSSTLADILTATGDILERLLRLLGSLLGLLLE